MDAVDADEGSTIMEQRSSHGIDRFKPDSGVILMFSRVILFYVCCLIAKQRLPNTVLPGIRDFVMETALWNIHKKVRIAFF